MDGAASSNRAWVEGSSRDPRCVWSNTSHPPQDQQSLLGAAHFLVLCGVPSTSPSKLPRSRTAYTSPGAVKRVRRPTTASPSIRQAETSQSRREVRTLGVKHLKAPMSLTRSETEPFRQGIFKACVVSTWDQALLVSRTGLFLFPLARLASLRATASDLA